MNWESQFLESGSAHLYVAVALTQNATEIETVIHFRIESDAAELSTPVGI